MPEVDVKRWAELSPLLDELLELDGEERSLRLLRIRSEDPALAGELDAFLAHQGAIGREAFLEGNALEPHAEATLTGQTIGVYTLQRALGAGGMGSVWLARRSDGRYQGKVAIKLLNLALLARGGAERFAREGDVLARLAHPNIARLLDAGVTASGQPYLVLEHVEGEPIDHWCDARALGIDARIRLLQGVLAAVAHAHSKLVLHRDLKPSNILVTHDGQVKLLDFGIAKLLDDEALPAQATELTQLAGRAFTPDYAAPEQVQGGDVTTATDVYALGVLLYVLLGGAHPTAKPTHTPVERLRSVVETEPQRLSEAAARSDPALASSRSETPRRLAQALRGDLDNIVAKALKKTPAERYPTAAAFADDLRRYLDHEPVVARADSLGYRSAKFVRRHRVAVGAASATLLALVFGVIGTTWQAVEARRERDEALFQAERASAKGNLVDLMLGALGDADRPLTQREILERSLALVDKQFGKDPRIAIDLLLQIAGQYMTLGDTQQEFAVMERAAAIAAAAGDPKLIANVACDTVLAEVQRKRLDQAQVQLRLGLQAVERMTRPEPETAIECLAAEAEVARAIGELDRAVDRIDEALRRAERAGRTKGNLYARLLGYSSLLHGERGDRLASFDLLQRRQRLDEAAGRTGDAAFLLMQRNEAIILTEWGEYLAAQAIIDGIVRRWQGSNADSPPPTWVEHTRGLLLLRFGDLEGARRALQGSAERSRAQGSVAQALPTEFALAQVLVELGRFGEAESILAAVEQAVPPGKSRYPRITPGTVRAQLLLARGAAGDAVRAIDSELARLGYPAAKDSNALAEALRVAARVHSVAGDARRSLQLASGATAVAERIARDPQRSADVGEGLLLVARAQRQLGDAAGSTATAQRAATSLASGLAASHALAREALALARR